MKQAVQSVLSGQVEDMLLQGLSAVWGHLWGL